MIKTQLYILVFIVASALSGCESTGDCFITTGKIIEVSLQVEDFTQLEINDYFLVTIRQGSDRSIVLKVGENLLDEIKYGVVDGIFSIQNENGCDWARKLDYPELIITAPNLTQVRLNGGGLIQSEGTLSYPSLHLISENVSGDFNLIVNSNELNVTNNSIVNYQISGMTNSLNVLFAAGNGRFDGHNLTAKKVEVRHSGSNEIIVHATESLTGQILSTGNLVYLKNSPAIIDVSVENRGKLIHRPD